MTSKIVETFLDFLIFKALLANILTPPIYTYIQLVCYKPLEYSLVSSSNGRF